MANYKMSKTEKALLIIWILIILVFYIVAENAAEKNQEKVHSYNHIDSIEEIDDTVFSLIKLPAMNKARIVKFYGGDEYYAGGDFLKFIDSTTRVIKRKEDSFMTIITASDTSMYRIIK